MTVEVVEATVDDQMSIEAIALANDRNMIYASPVFTRFLGAALGTEVRTLLARSDGVPAGVLHYAVSDGVGGHVMNSLPWYGTHGGCTVVPGAEPDVRRSLLSGYRRLVEDNGVLSSCVVMSPFEEEWRDVYDSELDPDATDERIGMYCPLLTDEAEQWGRMHQKTRNLVRKSLRQGFHLREDDSDRAWRFLTTTHEENISALGGKPKPPSHFEAMRDVIPTGNRRLLVASMNGRDVAALLLLMFNRTVEYFVPAVDVEFRASQAMSFLIWEGMRRMVSEGYQWWNWGGTWGSQESLFRFKSRWGSETLPYSYLINCPEENRRMVAGSTPDVFTSHEYFYLYPKGGLVSAE